MRRTIGISLLVFGIAGVFNSIVLARQAVASKDDEELGEAIGCVLITIASFFFGLKLVNKPKRL
jgi:hypothetical protein